jgi:hypothetical protein
VAGLLVLSACGGGSDDGATDVGSDDDTAAAVTTAPGPTAETAPADEAGESDDGESDAAPATDAPSEATTPATEGGADPVPVPEALQFSSALVGGGELDLATLAGRPVLLWFWAPF